MRARQPAPERLRVHPPPPPPLSPAPRLTGNCNPEDGKCQCPWGRTGDNCEVDALSACRLTPDHPRECRGSSAEKASGDLRAPEPLAGQGSPSQAFARLPYPCPRRAAHCGVFATKSCECARQCRALLCRPNAVGEVVCDGQVQDTKHGCFERTALPVEKKVGGRQGPRGDESQAFSLQWRPPAGPPPPAPPLTLHTLRRAAQTAMVPEADEEGVKYYEGYIVGEQREVSRQEAMTFDGRETMPLSRCPAKCSLNGVCINGSCQCNRGYEGASCETENAVGPSIACLNDCGGEQRGAGLLLRGGAAPYY